MKNVKIRVKLLILVVIAFVPMFILNSYMIINQRNQAVNAELQSNQEYAEAIGTAYMNYISKIWHTEFIVGQFLLSNKFENKNEIQEYLYQCASDDNTVANYLWISPDGKVIASSNPHQAGMVITDCDYYKDIINGKEKVISNLLYKKLTPTFAIAIARGIRMNGELKGIVMAGVDTQTFGAIMPVNGVTQTSTFGIVDKNGMLVYRNISKDLTFEKRKANVNSPIWKALKGEVASTKNYNSNVDGTRRMGISYPIAPIGWATYSSIAIDEAYASQNREAILMISIISLISVISVMIVLSFVLDILKPIEELEDAANKIACADYSVRINMDRKDELGQTANAFNKMAEGIEQYDRMKTEFFSNISHELKTPLNVIYSASQLISLKYNKLPYHNNEVSKYTHIINQNCFRLLRLICNLIDITKYDAGFLKINPINIDIVNLVEEITTSIVQYADSKGIKVVFDTTIEEKVIACDPDFIERIILNLLSNSIKYMDKDGSIFVNVYGDEKYISISVKDNGMGIPADKIGIIFERFRQVDTSLRREHEGSGIGLSLVKTLVEAHKGTVSAKSKVGEGTEFIVNLPVVTVAEEKEDKGKHILSPYSLVEKVNIEFSDIYNI